MATPSSNPRKLPAAKPFDHAQVELLQRNINELRVEPGINTDLATDQPVRFGLLSLHTVCLDQIVVDNRRIAVLKRLIRL
jgi:hypothetical protein